VTLSGIAIWTTRAPSANAAEVVVLKDHWRNHDGHWSYWHAGDKRWYYTDGAHWYYNDGAAWKIYAFDRGFGKEGFEHGTYRVPGEGVRVVVPGHAVYIPK
jgi:hypothetical protein